MDPIKEGNLIFQEVANSVTWKETKSIDEATYLIEKLIEDTKGLVIVDFLDSGNWDCIHGIEKDKTNNILKLHWRDYRDDSEDKLSKEVRMMAFPASLYSSIIKFKELRILDTKRYPVFLIRGFALKDKEIKKHLNPGATEFKILDNNDNFSKLALRKTTDSIESYTCLNTPIFSMIIIPKNSWMNAFDSKQGLLSYNISDSLFRLNKVKVELENEKLEDEDIICEKSNTVRRILEYVLKVELCYRYRQVTVKKDYSDLMLGDLIKLIKPFREKEIGEFLTKMTVSSNELSHESGKPITREKALLLVYMASLYTSLLKSEMNLNTFPESED